MDQLIFIYNAKSGLVNSIFDYVHKFVSPQTYSCNLCLITYDNMGKKDEWSNYLKSLSIEVIFAYKNNIKNYIKSFKYTNEHLPCAYLLNKDGFKLFISNKEMNNVKKLSELIELVNRKLLIYSLQS